ncbi:MAG: hypothetical protein CEN88_393 [Candidatus Berkelbacteria bacterium Licking1014_2]|uniref:Uncharacterized protein n=1 Tax=Candidatus Berkelbacteria bacterium Licking1014_2 TaxID=2017146 RepID=A0A554LTC1_9BACT|nr:MAG: hypothetical protein CEN88_393 [Candidatus Berkelbacteria bacterium Licking1014_2]
MVCTADGYYPYLEPPNSNSGAYLGLGTFDGMNPLAYRQGVMKAAQAKTRDLIDDLYQQADKTKKKSLPSQIMTYRKDDIDYFVGRSEKLYGQLPSDDFRRGLWQNDLLWDAIHVGY